MGQTETIPDPWQDAPDGTMPPFITPEERDRLITEKRVVFVLLIRQEGTVHGGKWYVDIMIPPNGIERTCSFTIDPGNTPRNRLLQHLMTWMTKYEVTALPVVLVRAGNGYMFARPPETAE